MRGVHSFTGVSYERVHSFTGVSYERVHSFTGVSYERGAFIHWGGL